jgi:hypothetical protein
MGKEGKPTAKDSAPAARNSSPPNGGKTVRCWHCGRYLGTFGIKDGWGIMPCKNCHEMTYFAEGPTGEVLTREDTYANLTAVGQKA